MAVLKRISHRCLSVFFIVSGAILISAQISTREYQVKAVFIFNFTQFVEWPPQSFPTAQSPEVIGILGEDPFNTYLEETISGEVINKHPLVIQHFNTVEEITNCHILFIGISDKKKLQVVLEKLKGKNILTIGDTNEFAKLGGMVRLYTRDDKINIQINLEAAKAENLIISSKLLKLAEIVKTGEK
jgi:hypothetical protein